MLRLGDHAAYCQVCGFRYLASELKRRWDGLLVCGPDWEPQHDIDQYYPRAVDEKLPNFVRNNDSSVGFTGCRSFSSVSGVAIAGCAISGRSS